MTGSSTSSKSRYPWLVSIALCGAGCAPQATTDYEGDSMFTMTGRVELKLEQVTDDLVPAIAFTNPDSKEYRFAEAKVSGEFPAGFRLDLFAPPPPEVVAGHEFADLPDEPHHSIGYVAAVTRNHPPVVHSSGAFWGEPSCNADGCSFELRASSPTGSTATVHCKPEHTPMPDGPADGLRECEVVKRTGEPFLVEAKDPVFAGAVNNYAVLYLKDAAEPSSFTAHRFGAPEGLRAGYHLMRMAFTYDAEISEQPCRDEAMTEAVERYNQAHGTNLTEEDVLIRYTQCPSGDGRCVEYGPHTLALRGTWYRLIAEAGCMFGPSFQPEPNPESALLAFTIQPGLSFLAGD